MTTEERAELSYKVAGLGIVVSGVHYVLVTFRRSAGLPGWASLLGGALVVLIGTLVIRYAERLSRPACRIPTDLADSPAAEAVIIGASMLGIWLMAIGVGEAATTVSFAMGARHDAGPGQFLPVLIIACAVVALGFWMTFRPARAGSILYRPIARYAPEARRSGRLLAVGIALVAAVSIVLRALGVGGQLLSLVLAPPGADLQVSNGQAWVKQMAHSVAAGAVGQGVGLVLALAVLLWAGSLARWLDARDGEEGGERPAPLSGGTWLGLAVFIALSYTLADVLARSASFLYYAVAHDQVAWDLVRTASPIAVGVVVLFLGGRGAPKLGRWLWHREREEAESDPGCEVAEVGLGVIALYLAVEWLSGWLRSRVLVEAGAIKHGPLEVSWASVAGGVVALLMLLFRSDLAGLFGRCRSDAAAISREHREQNLRPWLALLGLWIVLGAIPGAVAGAGMTVIGDSPLGPSAFLRLLAGLGLMLGSRTISRKLSYGRLLPRLRFGGFLPGSDR